MIYIIWNCSDDEAWFLLGAFLSKDDAVKAIDSVNLDYLEGVDEFATLAIYEIEIGMHGSNKEIARMEFKKCFKDDGEYEYDEDESYWVKL